ncbi:Crp/Fnr family transcriptional regulator [Ferroacidibacillus organovorans]|uniref:Crp/Fnr family transcriptional regulator n=1 Tax=Ferroacidibacillus organovorans TaxID=1765683 RepID=A0A101XRS3_9BACL|nr:Crp/Fnr family transcriptional regulator [Ferroacidibacillus organovorans]KUO96328.1 Crp/Fnr family transcriptional regulator [Ferroacidibacillus organovorans]
MERTGLCVLKEIELFRGLTDDELNKIVHLAKERRCHRGEILFMEGDDREAVFFLQRGLVKVFKVDDEGKEHIVNVLGAGQMFPHVGFFRDDPYPGTAQSLSESSLLFIKRTHFDALLMEHPEITRKVMRVMGEQILILQTKLQELATTDTRQRVYAFIRHICDEHGQPGEKGVHVKLHMTHEEIAHMIGMTRESVNRLWNELRRDGTIMGNREEWIFDLDRLRRV